MQQIALTCDHLDVDEALTTELPYIALQPAQLKKLTVSLLCQNDTVEWPIKASCSNIPDIRHLTQLKALHVRLDKYDRSITGSEILSRIPESLDNLTIQGYNWPMMPPSIQPLMQPCLARMQTLTLEECRVSFVGSSLTCLCNLTSFSAPCSKIWADINKFDKLTKLTCLDLTRSTWHRLSADRLSPRLLQPFTSFTGWSELQLFKVAGCNLFHPSTKLDLPRVQDIQVGFIVPKLVNNRLHVYQSHFAYWTLDPQSLLHPSCLVDLHLDCIAGC